MAQEINTERLEAAVAVGLDPHEICFVYGRSIPVDILMPMYMKRYGTIEKFLEFRQIRLMNAGKRGRRNLNRYDCRARNSMKQRLKNQLADVLLRDMGTFEDVFGYKIDDFMDHIQNNFKEGMSWKNRSLWEIDHIKPRRLFNKASLKECFALENMRPLWRVENRKKGSKYNG